MVSFSRGSLRVIFGVFLLMNFAVTRITAVTPSDVKFSDQWSIKKIKAPDAWSISQDSDGVIIAILDSGVDLEHPNLGSLIIPGINFINPGSAPEDDNGHGTHVAGIAAAVTGWKCKILPVKVLFQNKEGGLDIIPGGVAKGIRYAVDRGARVINLSLYQPEEELSSLQEAVKYAYDKKCVLVAAAGDLDPKRGLGNKILMPAAFREVIAVGATDENDDRFGGSPYGPELDVVAPGKDILSLAPLYNYDRNDRKDSGTSMAAPHVAGLAALILSKYPTWTPDQVMAQIKATADKAPVMEKEGLYLMEEYGYGRINAYRALTEFVPFPVITSSIQITSSPPYYVSDTISAAFTITNQGSGDVNFRPLMVGGRWNGGVLPNGSYPDFDRKNITLKHGESYPYSGTLTLSQTGNFKLFCAYQTPDGSWNTNVALEKELTVSSREQDIIVQLHPLSTIPDLSLVRESGTSRIYLLKNRKLYKILNEVQLTNLRQEYNFTGKDFTLTQEQVKQYPPGPDILTNGSIVKPPDSPGVYLIQNGMKRTFSAEGYLERGYNRFGEREAGDPDSPTYILMPSVVIDALPRGEDIRGGTANIKMKLYFKKNGKVDNVFAPGDTKESILSVEGGGYTARRYLKVIFPNKTEQYAFMVNPTSLDFTSEKRPLTDEAWNVGNTPAWTFNTFTIGAGTDIGKWTWKLWLEDINRPGLALASATASYFVTSGARIATAGGGGFASDFDGDGKVGFDDFFLFALKFGSQKGDGRFDSRFDLDLKQAHL